MSARRSRDDGAAAVEFALVLPVLIAILCGIVDFGRFYNTRIELSHAAREAVRVWALGGSEEDVTSRAEAVAGTAVTSVETTPCIFGEVTTVTLTVAFSFTFPLVTDVADLSELRAEGVMRCGG